jgi:hypothetical protein
VPRTQGSVTATCAAAGNVIAIKALASSERKQRVRVIG